MNKDEKGLNNVKEVSNKVEMKIVKMTEEEIKAEMEQLRKIIGESILLGKNIKKKFEEMGYQYAVLGTSRNDAIRSKEIKVMEFNNRKYLKGKYIVVGIYSLGKDGMGVFYRGYVKRIG